MPYRVLLLALLGSLVLGFGDHARAQSIDFKGKTVTVYIAFGTGGGYDQYGRLFARHVGRHIPGNPTVIPANMPGANGIVAANYLYNTAPKDGTALGFLYQTIAQDQVLLQSNVQYDATKFNWIGRITSTAEMLYTWHRVPVRRIEDLASRETVLGVGGPAIATYARLLNSSIGARFKLVRGYKSTAEIHIAHGAWRGRRRLQLAQHRSFRLEIPGCATSRSTSSFRRFRNAIPTSRTCRPSSELAQNRRRRAMMEFFAAGGAVGRSVVAPPGVAPATLQMLRQAFQTTMTDPQFLAEARQMKLDVEPLSGEATRQDRRTGCRHQRGGARTGAGDGQVDIGGRLHGGRGPCDGGSGAEALREQEYPDRDLAIVRDGRRYRQLHQGRRAAQSQPSRGQRANCTLAPDPARRAVHARRRAAAHQPRRYRPELCAPHRCNERPVDRNGGAEARAASSCWSACRAGTTISGWSN